MAKQNKSNSSAQPVAYLGEWTFPPVPLPKNVSRDAWDIASNAQKEEWESKYQYIECDVAVTHEEVPPLPEDAKKFVYDPRNINGVKEMGHAACFGCGKSMHECRPQSLSDLSYYHEYMIRRKQKPSPPIHYIGHNYAASETAGVNAGCPPTTDHIWVCWTCAH